MQTLKRAELECVAELLEKVRLQAEVDWLSVVADKPATLDARSNSSAEEAQGDAISTFERFMTALFSDANNWNLIYHI